MPAAHQLLHHGGPGAAGSTEDDVQLIGHFGHSIRYEMLYLAGGKIAQVC